MSKCANKKTLGVAIQNVQTFDPVRLKLAVQAKTLVFANQLIAFQIKFAVTPSCFYTEYGANRDLIYSCVNLPSQPDFSLRYQISFFSLIPYNT